MNYSEEISIRENRIKQLKLELEEEIERYKPNLKLQFLSNKELVDNDDPILAKTTQDNIKKEVKELQKLIDCLWK